MDGSQLLTLADFTTDLLDDEPRIADWVLARALSVADFHLRELIDRHRPNLQFFGTLSYRTIKSTGGRPGSEYRLNFNQAIFIIIKSEAPNALPVQIHVVKIYGLWAHGKLMPVDAETEALVADATAELKDQVPELAAALEEILTRVADLPTRADASDIADRVASVQRTALKIEERMGDVVHRRDALAPHRRLHDHVILKYFDGYCPTCDRKNRIINSDGTHTKLYHHDHWTGNKAKRGLMEMIPVCFECNIGFENKGTRASPRVKLKAELFFQYVHDESSQLFE